MEKIVDFLDEFAIRLFGAVVDMSKWVMASLLLINGGAILGLLQARGNGMDIPASAMIYFVSGIVCAILTGLGSAIVWAFLLLPLITISAVVRTMPDDAEQKVEKARGNLTAIAFLSAIPMLIGGASIFLFIKGAYAVIWAVHG